MKNEERKFTDYPDGWRFDDVEIRFGPGKIVKSITIHGDTGPEEYRSPGSKVSFHCEDSKPLIFEVGKKPDLE